VTEPQSPDNESSVIREPVIEIGDQVIVAYDDPPGQQAVLVVAPERHDPDMGIFKSSSPTSEALLGRTVDDEVTISVGDQSRTATILAIKKKPPRANIEIDSVHQRTVTQADPPLEKSATTKEPTGTRNTVHMEPETPRMPTQRPRPVERERAPDSRVVEELHALNERFRSPRCSQCSGVARIAIYTEGPVVACVDPRCRKVERVDAQTLKRLAERLGASCYKCKGTNLESATGRFGNYLKCRDCGANNSWQGVRERTGK
jgi:hypothetical protein